MTLIWISVSHMGIQPTEFGQPCAVSEGSTPSLSITSRRDRYCTQIGSLMFYDIITSFEDYDGKVAWNVFILFLPFVFLYWWMRLTPRGCHVSIWKRIPRNF